MTVLTLYLTSSFYLTQQNNRGFVASEHDIEAAPSQGRGEQSAQGFGRAALLPIISGNAERNKITEVLLRSVMKKGTLRENAGAFDILIAVRGGVFGCALPVTKRKLDGWTSHKVRQQGAVLTFPLLLPPHGYDSQSRLPRQAP